MRPNRRPRNSGNPFRKRKKRKKADRRFAAGILRGARAFPLFHRIDGQEDPDLINRIKTLIGKIYPFHKDNFPILRKISSLFQPFSSPFVPCFAEARAKSFKEALPKTLQGRVEALQAAATSLYLEKILKVFCQKLTALSEELRSHETDYGIFLRSLPASLEKNAAFFPLCTYLFEKISKKEEQFKAVTAAQIKKTLAAASPTQSIYASAFALQKKQGRLFSFLEEIALEGPLPELRSIAREYLKFLKVRSSLDTYTAYHSVLNVSALLYSEFSQADKAAECAAPHLRSFVEKHLPIVDASMEKMVGMGRTISLESTEGGWVFPKFFSAAMLLRHFGNAPQEESCAFYSEVYADLIESTKGKASLIGHRKIKSNLELPFLDPSAALPPALDKELPFSVLIHTKDDGKESLAFDEKEFGQEDSLLVYQQKKSKKKPLRKPPSALLAQSAASAPTASSSSSSSSQTPEIFSPPSFFPFSYDQRVARWWDASLEPSEFPGYEQLSASSLEMQILFHGFSRSVDAFYRIGKELTFGNQSHAQYTIPAEIVYKEALYRGIITYTIDAAECCYHRYFHQKSLTDCFFKEEFYAVDFPTIQQAYAKRANQPASICPPLQDSENISYDEALGVISIQDLEPPHLDSPVTIRLFNNSGSAFNKFK